MLLRGLEERLSLDMGLDERLLLNLGGAAEGKHLQSATGFASNESSSGLPLLQHGLLLAQVGHLLPQQAHLSLVVVYGVHLPLVNVQLLVR